MQLKPFQFDPAAQLTQLTPLQLSPLGQAQLLRDWLQVLPPSQTIHENPFQN